MAVESTLVFMSIIILVVIELSKEVDDLDLKKIVSQSEGNLLFLPNIGRFSIIHTFNTCLIYVSYFILLVEYINTKSIIIFVLVSAVILLMMLLPLLETKVYRNHLARGSFPKSVVVHFWYTVASTIIFPAGMLFVMSRYSFPFLQFIFAMIFSLLWISGSDIYLNTLKREIKQGSL